MAEIAFLCLDTSSLQMYLHYIEAPNRKLSSWALSTASLTTVLRSYIRAILCFTRGDTGAAYLTCQVSCFQSSPQSLWFDWLIEYKSENGPFINDIYVNTNSIYGCAFISAWNSTINWILNPSFFKKSRCFLSIWFILLRWSPQLNMYSMWQRNYSIYGIYVFIFLWPTP